MDQSNGEMDWVPTSAFATEVGQHPKTSKTWTVSPRRPFGVHWGIPEWPGGTPPISSIKDSAGEANGWTIDWRAKNSHIETLYVNKR